MHKFGFVFPGQGSQKLGMLGSLANDYSLITDTFKEASDVLDLDLWEIAQHDSENNLDQTHITQPVLLAASVAIWRLWQKRSPLRPSVLAGHSLGEYSALVCADVLSLADAVNVVHQRGRFMQAAVPPGVGKMAAIVGLEDYQIHEICDEAEKGEVVSAANFNSPGQTVIAGDASAVERAIILCKDAGAKRALPLNVSVPSHCALMKPAAIELEKLLDDIEFSAPSIAVVQNVNGELVDSPSEIKLNLIKQLYAPVLWVDCIGSISETGVTKLVECGPGKVLSGLIKRIDSDIRCFGSDDTASLNIAIGEMVA
jgi:[acyl-carrier-protein] S-malonyltransferase|tara:strand:- start:12897 stop:13835 length:939 start_codon:yes stop_codon:yes gene_type:complete